jgi:hypothetical protein
MNKLHQAVVEAIFKLESNGDYTQAKELLLAFLEFRKSLNTLPKYISSTSSGFKPTFSKAPLIAAAPILGAETDDNAPIKLPIAVLTADTIYTSLI